MVRTGIVGQAVKGPAVPGREIAQPSMFSIFPACTPGRGQNIFGMSCDPVFRAGGTRPKRVAALVLVARVVLPRRDQRGPG